jgi:hypothetical protein
MRMTAAGRRLTGAIESHVRGFGSILRIIEQNTPQIFAQFEMTSAEKLFT